MNESLQTGPLVSIIMCAYNTRAYIETAVKSILNQTYTNWELIISDDGSTDGQRDWLRENLSSVPNVRLFFQESNLGYVANKNFAFAQAKGDYLTQCDSDDYYDPELLQKQIAVTGRHPDIKIVACGYQKVDMHGNVFRSIGPAEDEIIDQYNGEGYPFWFPPILAHREVFEKIGYFTYFFPNMGDDLYWVAKANEHYRIYCLKDRLYYYRDSPNATSRRLDDKRKLIAPGVLWKLLQQRKATGTDWLDQQDFEAIKVYEASLFGDRKYMGAQYRLWATKAIDTEDWKQSVGMLQKAFSHNPLDKSFYRTLFYYLRKRTGLIKG